MPLGAHYTRIITVQCQYYIKCMECLNSPHIFEDYGLSNSEKPALGNQNVREGEINLPFPKNRSTLGNLL
jgi:hypothetical protein